MALVGQHHLKGSRGLAGNNPHCAVIEVRVRRQERRPTQVRYEIGHSLAMKAAGNGVSMKIDADHP